MKDAVLEYEICNWDRYNPRTDAKACNWSRLDTRMASSADCMRMDDKTFRVWVAIMCDASPGRGRGKLALSHLASVARTTLSRAACAVEWLISAMMLKGEIKLLPLRARSYVRNVHNETYVTNSLTKTPDPEPEKQTEKVSEGKTEIEQPDSPDVRDEDFTAAENQAIVYAEEKLDRPISDTEARNFVTAWRQKPKVTLERIKNGIDWVAAHPMARLDTASVARILHDSQIKKAYFEWDKARLKEVNSLLAQGVKASELVSKMVAAYHMLDAEVMRTYLERLCESCGYPVRKFAPTLADTHPESTEGIRYESDTYAAG